MIIKTDNPGTKAFYKEIVNVLMKYRRLVKRPTRRLVNMFLIFTVYAAIGAVLLALWLIPPFMRESRMAPLGIGISCILLLLSGAFLLSFYRTLRMLQNGFSPSVLTLDETGVEMKKEGANTLRVDWGSVSFVRVLPQSVCIAAKEPMRCNLHVERRYAEAIVAFLRETRPEVPVICD